MTIRITLVPDEIIKLFFKTNFQIFFIVISGAGLFGRKTAGATGKVGAGLDSWLALLIGVTDGSTLLLGTLLLVIVLGGVFFAGKGDGLMLVSLLGTGVTVLVGDGEIISVWDAGMLSSLAISVSVAIPVIGDDIGLSPAAVAVVLTIAELLKSKTFTFTTFVVEKQFVFPTPHIVDMLSTGSTACSGAAVLSVIVIQDSARREFLINTSESGSTSLGSVLQVASA